MLNLFSSVQNVSVSDIDDCKDGTCLNGGTCTDKVADFSCSCQAGFSSKTCTGMIHIVRLVAYNIILSVF